MVRECWTLVRASRLVKRRGWKAVVDALPAVPMGDRPVDDERLRELSERCAAAARWCPMDTRCVERTFALCSILRRHGIAAMFNVGVARLPPTQFHAWAQVGDKVVNDGQELLDDYLVVSRF